MGKHCAPAAVGREHVAVGEAVCGPAGGGSSVGEDSVGGSSVGGDFVGGNFVGGNSVGGRCAAVEVEVAAEDEAGAGVSVG